MPLSTGTRLGSYEVLSTLGAGGMGEVYRAHDTKLGRDVAIKVVLDAWVSDRDRLMRFEREARALAALNHPNIATLHGMEEADGRHFLVMELVEGPTLAELMSQAAGPMPLDEALPIATQIAHALEAAHEAGIVHRDLKPANVKVRGDGAVKVLDFGLAKAIASPGSLDPGLQHGANAPADSPTLTARATAIGLILGTAAYMAPEQARGRAVDRRADIWAFGVVLYEMLTGHRAFPGEDVSDVLAAVLRQDIDWTALPAGMPPRVRRLLGRCLDRDPRRRLRDIGEARVMLEAPDDADDTPAPQPAAHAPARRGPWIAIAAAAAMAAALLTLLATRPPAPSPLFMSIPMPPGLEFAIGPATPSNLALSPDGMTLAFAAMPLGRGPEESALFLRRLDQAEAVPIADNRGSRTPFFSPDGRWVAFHAESALWKVSVGGGAPAKIMGGLPHVWGSAWLPGDTIVYSNPLPTGDMLFTVPASGGEPEPFSRVDHLNADHSFPHRLHDGDLLITMWTGGLYTEGRIARLARDTKTTTTVYVEGGSQGRVVGNQLIYARGSDLFAMPFREESGGAPVKAQSGVLTDLAYATAQFDTAPTGTLAWAPASGTTYRSSLIWLSAGGQTEVLLEDPRLEMPGMSADGRQVLFVSTQGRDKDIWLYDVATKRRSRLTTELGEEYSPAISADGGSIVFNRWGRDWGLYLTSRFGGNETRLTAPADRIVRGMSFSPDARWLLVVDDVPGSTDDRTATDIGIVDLDAASHVPRWLTQSRFRHDQPRFSPSGRFVAFMSNQLGQMDVWVTAAPGHGPWAPVPVSTNGGADHFWSADSRTMYFVKDGTLMASTIGAGATPSPSAPREVMPTDGLTMVGAAPDGRFLAVKRERSPVTRIDLILNWPAITRR